MPIEHNAPGERRRQQRALDTCNALLDTAIEDFSLSGFEGISVRQLEERAGVKRGLVAYHFGDKDELWRCAVDRLFQGLTEDFLGRMTQLSEISPLEAARGMVRAFVRYSAAHPELNRLMMQESVAASWRVEYIVEQHIRPLMKNLAELMPEAAELVWGRSDPHRYYLFIGASAFVFSAGAECQQLFGCSPQDADFVERQAEMVVSLLLPNGATGL